MTTPTTLRAAPLAASVTPQQTQHFLTQSSLFSGAAEPFLAAVEAADFSVALTDPKVGRLHRVVAYASTRIETETADYARADLLRVAMWLFEAAVRKDDPKVKVDFSIDTRSKACNVAFEVRVDEVPKGQIDAARARVQALLVRHFGPSLHAGIEFARRAIVAVRAAAEAKHALLEGATEAKAKAEADMDYAAKLQALKEEREAKTSHNLARMGFLDLSTDALLLITPEARQAALDYVLCAGPFGPDFQITPVL